MKVFKGIPYPNPIAFARKISFSVWEFMFSKIVHRKLATNAHPALDISHDRTFIVNVDASMTNHSKPSCVAACLRNSRGDWIMGCQRSIMVHYIYMAELHAIFDGINLAKRKCINNFVLVSDCQRAITRINQEEQYTDLYANMVRECRVMLQEPLQVKCVFMKRDWNRVADALAREGRILDLNRNSLRDIAHPPNYCINLLKEDCKNLFK